MEQASTPGPQRMKRIILLLLLAFSGLAAWLISPPRPPADRVVAVLQYTDNNLSTLEGFLEGLRQSGYVEGENLTLVFEGPVQRKEDLGPAMQQLLRHRPDLIFASPTPAAKIAADLTRESGIPVLFAPVNDPVASGVVLDQRRPEANITGVRLPPSEGRRLQSLQEVAPHVHTVFVPYNPEDSSARASLNQLFTVAPDLDVTLLTKPFSVQTDPAEPGYVPAEADAVFLPREGLVMSRIDDFVEVCNARGLALSTPRYEQVMLGALTGLGFMGREVGQQAARMGRLLLIGTPVAGIPVETAREYLFVNMDTAERIGLTVPETVLRRASRIIRTLPPGEGEP